MRETDYTRESDEDEYGVIRRDRPVDALIALHSLAQVQPHLDESEREEIYQRVLQAIRDGAQACHVACMLSLTRSSVRFVDMDRLREEVAAMESDVV